jgi:hypothetical protein
LSDHLQKVSLALWTPATNIAIDEAMLRFLGRAIETLKIPSKPISEGFKLWVVAQKGYFLQWLFHMPGKGPVGCPKVKVLNPTQSVVPFLVKKLPYWEKGRYHVFLDNLFTSAPLFVYLHHSKIGASGTARKNAGLHKDIVQVDKEEKKKDVRTREWGNSTPRVVKAGLVSQIGWKDNSLVKHMSNYIDCSETTHQSRRRPGPRSNKAYTARAYFGDDYVKEVPVPQVNYEYQQHMGYIDQGDQLRASFTSRREQKNWKALFNGLLGIAIVNMYLLSHHSPGGAGYHCPRDFRKQLYKQLWKDPGQPNWANTESLLGKRTRVSTGEEHIWSPRKQARCVFCSLKVGRALAELPPNHVPQKRPKGGCDVCEVNLCQQGECFDRWHDNTPYK